MASAGATGASRAAEGAERHRVHGSYVWLGSLRMVAVLVVAGAVSSASALGSLMEELGTGGLRGSAAVAIPLMALWAVAVLLVICGATFAIHALAYRHLWYELGPEEFSLCSGILSKKRVHVPYGKVQSVDQRASLLQRAFGVCNVSIDTAGGADNKAILVPYLTKQGAEQLRAELFARKQAAAGAPGQAAGMGAAAAGATGARAGVAAGAPAACATQAPAVATQAPERANVLDVGAQAWREVGEGVFAGEAVDLGAPAFEYGLTNKELLLTGLSNGTAFLVVVAMVVAGIIQVATTAFDLLPGSEDAVMGTVQAAASAQAAPLVALGALALLGACVVAWAVSALGACLSFGGFRARRRGDRIEVERGLLQHRVQGVSIERVQSVVVKQSLVRRLLGYCEVSLGKVDAASSSSEQQSGLADQGLIVHPFARVSQVPSILEGLVPEFSGAPDAQDGQPLAKAALRRGLLRRCVWQGGGFWLIVGTVIVQALCHWALDGDPSCAEGLAFLDMAAIALCCLGVVLAACEAVSAVLWARSSRLATSRRFACFRNGGLSTESVMLPRQKIQFGYAQANPLQRAAGTATACARTAAGVGGTTVRLVDLEAADAEAWLAWLEPHAQGPAGA